MQRYGNLATHLWLKAVVESPLWPRLVDRNPEKAVVTYWRYKMRSDLELQHPITLNEKIQWLKLYGDRKLWSQWADKYQAKQLLKDMGLERYVAETLGVWDCTDDIDLAKLPSRFVLKCTHDCGSTIVVHDKSRLNIAQTKRQLARRLRQPYGYHSTELHYIDIPRRVMAEALIGNDDSPTQSLTDYKFWCFNGHAELCFICYNRGQGAQQHHVMKDLYTAHDFKPFREGLVASEQPTADQPLMDCPENYDEMLHLAEHLSKGHPEVRVDLYNINGKIYFGEMTFTSFGGIMRYFTPKMQQHLGTLTDLKII